MSKCEIKVFYIGENRNQSFISKETALEMAKTLRGAPIVGYYKDEKEDFADHGNRLTIDDEGIHFEVLTKPYGFVAPDADVWFQKFTDIDDFGNEIEREYLVTTGYLWTGQFPEAQSVLDGGKPQSMELDESTLDGHWATNNKNGLEFFIINDAIVSKLCILGDDVEPCFEGAAITGENTTPSKFTLDDDFKKSLFTMMKELEFALKGDNTVEQLENQNVETTEVVESEFVEQAEDNSVETVEVENQENIEDASNSEESTEFVKKDEEEDEEASEEEADDSDEDPEDSEDDKENKVNHSLHTDEEYAELETKFQALQESYSALEAEKEELVNFKNTVEDKQKDELIAKFFMLSDEDKQDVIANKRQYSLEDIESKLAVICYRKKINFVEDASDSTSQEVVVTFDMNDASDDSTPEWVKLVEANQNKL